MLCYYRSGRDKCPGVDILYHFPEVEGINIRRPKHYGRHLEDDTLKRLFMDGWNICILFKFDWSVFLMVQSLRATLVYAMAPCWKGGKLCWPGSVALYGSNCINGLIILHARLKMVWFSCYLLCCNLLSFLSLNLIEIKTVFEFSNASMLTIWDVKYRPQMLQWFYFIFHMKSAVVYDTKTCHTKMIKLDITHPHS